MRLTCNCRKRANVSGQKPRLPNLTGSPSAYRPPGATTTAAVIEPRRMAITSPGRQVVSGAVPRSWQRYSRQAPVHPMA
jgi:hypothetical protein